jgi:DNA-binding transcriptional regulator of glucitol operon
MKHLILCAGLFIGVINMAEAQTKKAATKAQTREKKAAAKQQPKKLENTTSNQAKAPAIPRSSLGWRNTPVQTNNLQIADPIINTLNARANGANTNIEFKDLMGVGRGTYGVANGRIMLRPTGSTTSGGITGSGAVGTGSSPGAFGIHGIVTTVNGKNPYSGPGMWGTTGTGIGTNYRMTDNSSQSIQTKKDD